MLSISGRPNANETGDGVDDGEGESDRNGFGGSMLFRRGEAADMGEGMDSKVVVGVVVDIAVGEGVNVLVGFSPLQRSPSTVKQAVYIVRVTSDGRNQAMADMRITTSG